MHNQYNMHYKQKDYFGEPYPGLVDFFKKYPERNRVLDLGCGQGRDALFLGSIGYSVTGVDISDAGIEQMNSAAQSKKLPVKGIVADIYTYKISKQFDMVLLDSIFHFYKNDLEKEKELVKRIVIEIRRGGVLCNFMQKGSGREKELKNTVRETRIPYEVILDDYTDYPEHDAQFHMYVIKKL